jgi:glutathione S-transferase
VIDAAVLAFVERRDRAPEQQSAKWIERQMGKVQAGLREMSARLGESSYCMGIHYTLADVAVGCALGWLSLRFPGIDWRGDYPNLARLADKLAERPSFRDTAPPVA